MTNMHGTSESHDIARALGRIEGKLDSLGVSFLTHVETDAKNFAKVDSDIDNINKKIWTLTGATAAGSLLLGTVLSYFKLS